MDGFRRAHELYTAEDTFRWMERNGVTHEKLERLVGDEARVAKLRNRVTAGRVEDYFERFRASFDTVRIARIELSDEMEAHRTADQMRAGAVDFYEAAQHRFLATECPGDSLGNLLTVVQRGQAPAELAEAVFTASPGDILGPVPVGEGYAIVRVLSFAPARLD